MNELIGTSPLGLAMIKHKNEIIARNGLGMGAKNINGKLRSTLAKRAAMIALQQKEFHATTAQHAKEIKALTATVKEQASQIQKLSDRLEHLNERKLMISKIISRAACLTELTSNPKSFSNCPDLHGGVPGLPGDRIYMRPALGKEKVVPLAIAVLVA
jgi:cell division protein FtsB